MFHLAVKSAYNPCLELLCALFPYFHKDSMLLLLDSPSALFYSIRLYLVWDFMWEPVEQTDPLTSTLLNKQLNGNRVKVEHLCFVSLHWPSAIRRDLLRFAVALWTRWCKAAGEKHAEDEETGVKLETQREREGGEEVTNPQRGAEFHRCFGALASASAANDGHLEKASVTAFACVGNSFLNVVS